MNPRLGVTYIVPPGKEATGVYQDESGIDIFETDSPYHIGSALQAPLPVKEAENGDVFFDSMGNSHKALAVLGVPVDPAFIVTHGGEAVTHNGVSVTYGTDIDPALIVTNAGSVVTANAAIVTNGA